MILTQERRQFLRVIYQASALIQQDDIFITASVRDLSLHGILLASKELEQLDLSLPAKISFRLPETDIELSLNANLIGVENNRLRTSIQNIDIESIVHLKRLLELNVGDSSFLHREIQQLVDLHADAEEL